MIYLNLLVLEASLRAQYLELRARRRHHTFFLTLLTLWIAAFGYGLFLRLGRMAAMADLSTGVSKWPRSSSYRYVDPAILREVEKDLNIRSDTHTTLPILLEDEERGGHEEDLSPGGDYVKLLLLPKYFTANFRENWELYRTEYWERENERRALLRSKLKSKSREYARQRWGIFWWMPWHQGDINHSSRSATPTIEMEDPTGLMRKVSSGSATSEKARKRLSATAVPRRRPESRSVTPDIPSPLAQESHLGDDVGAMGYVRRKSSGASLGSAKEFK
ncbi:unnamed protein product [Parascedosporium putredinis]|uniref:Uncharacterized protein n=1 Tax=Parascedosporium putredinis TaxID=1442378 RepID=A0A9P1H3V6_9PEZI|nr:unnamed protein product [Parascedosporium putredinis]CAI7995052.1 unnamed protein product [Parascedosporium putredinis]